MKKRRSKEEVKAIIQEIERYIDDGVSAKEACEMAGGFPYGNFMYHRSKNRQVEHTPKTIVAESPSFQPYELKQINGTYCFVVPVAQLNAFVESLR
jgi:hypothetical protein